MKTYRSYAIAAVYPRGIPLYSKLFFVLLIITLMFAFFPIASALAAPASDGTPIDSEDLDLEWSNKLRNLRALGFFYERVRLVPADFEDPDDLARAHFYLEKYGFALKQANTVVFNHTGFDIKGNVTNEIQAVETLHDLGMYLHMMRGFRAKMDEINGEITLARR